jgi:hypothetical protein
VAIQHIFTYLVHPKKGIRAASATTGLKVELHGRLFDLLNNIYVKSDDECDIDITFSPTSDGVQQNDCRDLLCTHLGGPTLETGRAIAQRLEIHTDGRSGLGLLFLIAGKEGREHKLVISRFPTDNAIYVDEDPRKLTVRFLERVFLKHKSSYKAVLYRDASLKGGLWNGRAVDRQLNVPGNELSNYWIVDFLASEFTVTPAAGTQRLAAALRNAAKKVSLDVKREIVAAATLATGLGKQKISIDEFNERFGLSDAARTAILRELKSPRLAQDRFQFDLSEFQSIATFRSVELSNGATLTAPSSDFDDVFEEEPIEGSRGEVRFTTQGRVLNEKIRSTT